MKDEIIADIGTLLIDFDRLLDEFRKNIGAYMKYLIQEVINSQGGNPQWTPNSILTAAMKGSTAVMKNEGNLMNTVSFEISDSDFDQLKDVVKAGWFENSAESPYIAAIHEFGLTGQITISDDGIAMGGAPIGRTPEARRKIRNWFYGVWGDLLRQLGINISGIIVIPERPILRRAGDILADQVADMFEALLYEYLKLAFE